MYPRVTGVWSSPQLPQCIVLPLLHRSADQTSAECCLDFSHSLQKGERNLPNDTNFPTKVFPHGPTPSASHTLDFSRACSMQRAAAGPAPLSLNEVRVEALAVQWLGGLEVVRRNPGALRATATPPGLLRCCCWPRGAFEGTGPQEGSRSGRAGAWRRLPEWPGAPLYSPLHVRPAAPMAMRQRILSSHVPPCHRRMVIASRSTCNCGVSGGSGSGVRKAHRLGPTTRGVCRSPSVCGVGSGLSGRQKRCPVNLI